MAYTNGYFICVYPLCLLENGDLSECYTSVGRPLATYLRLYLIVMYSMLDIYIRD